MTGERRFDVLSRVESLEQWREQRDLARQDPDRFWLHIARERVSWRRPPQRGLDGSFTTIKDGPLSWFSDGQLNVTESCLDRHAQADPQRVALIWEGDEPGQTRHVTYGQLLEQVCRAADALASLGIQKGDRVVIYMGMVPEAAVAMLACARLGAIHSVVFGGFSAEALRDRVRDCQAEVVITQNVGRRAGKLVPLKAVVDEALLGERGVRHVLVYEREPAPEVTAWIQGRDVWWHEALQAAKPWREAAVCDAEDPLFILYTSGSTGRPKGVVHTCGGYLTYVTYTHGLVFNLRPDDVYACMADVGWITGHSYIVYGPLSNGATSLMFESTPLYPDAGRYWDVVQRHKVTIFYTAPTAIRALAAAGDEHVTRYDRSSLRVLGTVGEPINPEAWRWYHDVVGQGRCDVVDTWWQTETGGVCISAIAQVTPGEPGSATLPLPGVAPLLVDSHGERLWGPGEGYLCIEHPWPGQARTVWGDHDRFVSTYFSTYPGLYFTGDGCRRDTYGYHWITGRVDDVINVSGHRMGTAEFESALVTLDEIAEAAVVGYPHPLKGQGVFAYVVLQPGCSPSDALVDQMQQTLRASIGAHARADKVQFVPGLPKTRSGKVMRRIMRKIAEDQPEAIGDTSTLADPEVVEHIKRGLPWGQGR